MNYIPSLSVIMALTTGNRLSPSNLDACFAHFGVIYFLAIGTSACQHFYSLFSSGVLRGGKWKPEPSPEVRQ